MTPIEWERACAALATLVRAEYPAGRSLAQIAETWGLDVGLTPEQIEAVRRYEDEGMK